MNLELDSEKSRNRKRRGMTTQCLVGYVKDFDLSRRSHWKGGWAANQEYIPPQTSLHFGSQKMCCREVEVVKTGYAESVFHLTNVMSDCSVSHTVLGPRIKKTTRNLTDLPSKGLQSRRQPRTIYLHDKDSPVNKSLQFT